MSEPQIRASVESLEAFAQARVPEEPPPPPPPLKGISWRGSGATAEMDELIHQGLVVSGLATRLTARGCFVVPSSESTTEAKIESIKTALRELGLSEETTDAP